MESVLILRIDKKFYRTLIIIYSEKRNLPDNFLDQHNFLAKYRGYENLIYYICIN